MEFFKKENIKVLSNPGCDSLQLLYPENSKSERVTITEVHVSPEATQPRHKHDTSEQIWYALKGNGKLLLADDRKMEFNAGDIVRFSAGDIHGLINDSNEEFVYITVTSPPINFKCAYKTEN